ncbi:MAG: type IX secretion system protein PorQ [Bacteroidota bacterium]
MTTRVGAVVFLTIIFCTPSFAGAGETTYNFLRNDVGARAAAMGGSFIAVKNDVNMLFYNPAGLSTLEKKQVSLGFLKHLLDVNSGHISYSQQFRNLGWFGAGIDYIHYGEFTRTDSRGNKLGTFGATDLALVLGYSNVTSGGVHYGVNGKLIYSSIADVQSAAVALDAGVIYQVTPERFAIGASILHVGRQIDKYNDTREDLPLELRVGFALRPEHLPLLLNVSFNRLNEETSDAISRLRAFSVGGELALSEVIQVRFGYDNERRKDLKIGTSAGLAGFSLGMGILIDRYTVDYAFNSLGKIGSLHRVTIGRSF